MDTIEVADCLHCGKPIRKFHPYEGAQGVWMHLDGLHAYEDCRGLKAAPKPVVTESTGRHAQSGAN
jgi:hypothetical protein